ncbi:MAG: phytanoyl-CoA dioxygenase family protein [Caulobacterales bacterium]|nr:phytanoyl-CoA dioxygenase family protein [Caulobacterales bacterium]
MNAQAKTIGNVPMPPMIEANAHLGDRQALHALMDREGYLFFRDVLDQDAIGEIKRAYMKVLTDMGVVDAGATEPVWNGADLTNFPVKFEQLHEVKVWERFAEHPKINAFFRELLGDDPFWLPIVEYRIFPPLAKAPEDPFFGRHQDGFYNGDLDCWTCWVPLVDVNADTGGLAMASGQHKRGYLHDVNAPPQYYIPGDAIPSESWRRSEYKPSDVVVFNRWIPHCGMDNFSKHFRMSMDIRVMPVSGDLPVWGKVQTFTPSEISVQNHDGKLVSLRVDDETYSRWTGGKRIATEELIALIPPGDDVLAFHKDGHATMLRPPR